LTSTPSKKTSTTATSLSSKQTPSGSAPAQTSTDQAAIAVNQQACPAILKQILELLSTLARAANLNFFPRQPFAPQLPAIQGSKATPSSSAAAATSTSAKSSQFWDIVVKLDQSKTAVASSSNQQTPSTSGKSKGVPPPQTPPVLTSQKSTDLTSQQQLSEFSDSDVDFTVENSPLARLMLMLDSPVLKHNPQLMDKMLTCLAYASAGIPQLDAANNPNSTAAIIRSTNRALAASSAANTDQTMGTLLDNDATITNEGPSGQVALSENEPVLSKQIELVVGVLKNKLCTQDGLQQAYTLLNNLSKVNSATRTMIIQHLLKGTRELGMAVCAEIERLLDEALKYNSTQVLRSQQPTTSAAAANDENMMAVDGGALTPQGGSGNRLFSAQQTLIDSYSNLVISSPKQKTARGELQLPSMSILVEKNANQKFFVRLIRLIISLREAIEKEHKKKKNVQSAMTAASTAAAAATAASNAAPATTEQV
jgi:hypothetical protein